LQGDAARVRQVVLGIAALAALAYVGYSIWRFQRQPLGHNLDVVTLVCEKCQAESTIGSRHFAQIPKDDETGNLQCPRCGQFGASLGVITCPSCKRWISSNRATAGGEFVCPYCNAPLDRQP
jgi:DNA-directed RNA polymerase subunit RPC12/RpoP